MERIIVIDSGINYENKSIMKKVIGGIRFLYDPISGEILQSTEFQDVNGHGTCCVETILSVYSEVEFFIIRITNHMGQTSSKLLLEALRYCGQIDGDTICISLSVTRDGNYDFLEEAFQHLYMKKRAICVSVHNDKTKSVPACFTSVIGVKGHLFYDHNTYIFDKYNMCALFDATPVLVNSVYDKYTFFRGNSKANAVCVGTIAKLKGQSGQLEINIEELLTSQSVNSKAYKTDRAGLISKEDYMLIKQSIHSIDKENLQDMLSLFAGELINQDEIEWETCTPLISEKTGLTFENFYNFLKLIEKRYHYQFGDYHRIKFLDVYYMGNFIEFLKRCAYER